MGPPLKTWRKQIYIVIEWYNATVCRLVASVNRNRSLVPDRNTKNSVVVISAGLGAANAAQVAEAIRYKLDLERDMHPDSRSNQQINGAKFEL